MQVLQNFPFLHCLYFSSRKERLGYREWFVMVLVHNTYKFTRNNRRIYLNNPWPHHICSFSNKRYRAHIDNDYFQKLALQQQFKRRHQLLANNKEDRLFVLYVKRDTFRFSLRKRVFLIKEIRYSKLCLNFSIKLLNSRFIQLLQGTPP